MKYYLGPWVRDFRLAIDAITGLPVLVPFWRAPTGTVGLIDFRSIPGHAAATNGFFAVADGVTLGSDYRLFGQGYITEVVPPESDRSIFASMLGMPSVTGDTLMDWVWDALGPRADPTGNDRVRPLMPTTRRELEVHLGGHSLVRRKAFDLTMPEAANVIAVVQGNYAAIRQQSLAGKLGRYERGRGFVPDPQFHRRYLRVLEEKFGVNNGGDIFIPAGLPKEKSLPHNTTLTESFNKADGALGPDQPWGELVASAAVVSNEARSVGDPTNPGYRLEADLSTDDHEVEAIVNASAKTSAYVGVFARKDTTSSPYNYYLSMARYATDEISLESPDTVLAAAAQSLTAGVSGTLKGRHDGSSHSTYWNGALVAGPVTDTLITGQLRTGFSGYKDSGGYVSWDSFEAADWAPEVAGKVISYRNFPKHKLREAVR